MRKICLLILISFIVGPMYGQLYIPSQKAIGKDYLGTREHKVTYFAPQSDYDFEPYENYRILSFQASDYVLLKESVDSFFVFEYLPIDTNMTAPSYHVYTFHTKPDAFIALDSMKHEERRAICLSIADKMTALQQHYLKNYNRAERLPDSTEFIPYMNDVYFYKSIYKLAEMDLGELSLNNQNLFEQNLRINVLGDYYYNGDSGEGYYTFAKFFALKPEWVVAAFNDSKDEDFKSALIARLHNDSQWGYAFGYWFYFFMQRNPKLNNINVQPLNELIKEVSKIYIPFVKQIDSNWSKELLRQPY